MWLLIIDNHFTREPTSSPVLTKWWMWGLILATNFGSPLQMVTKVGSQILATKFGFVPDWLTLITSWISNNMLNKVWDEITHTAASLKLRNGWVISWVFRLMSNHYWFQGLCCLGYMGQLMSSSEKKMTSEFFKIYCELWLLKYNIIIKPLDLE